MNDLRTAMIQKQIQLHYPNARIVSCQDRDSCLRHYTEEQLHQLRGDWFPLSCHRDEATGKLVFGGSDDVAHTYTIGETGSGKTTRFAMQSIRALSSLPEKPSFLINDMHGEIIENLYTHLTEQGYAIKILNCDDPSRSDTYNPFGALVKHCQQHGQLDDEGHDMLRKIAEIMQPVNSTQDPIWDMGARAYTLGCILDKFEDLLNDEIPARCITLYNIIENHYWLREQITKRYRYDQLLDIPHYEKKGRNAMSVQKLLAVTDNAEKTRSSYWGVVENHYDIFGQPSLYRLSSCSTIDVEAFLESPTVIVVQSGNTACGDHLVSMLVNDIYSMVVRKGKQQRSKRLPRQIHCFLDEFANCHIADGSAFIKMLTTSRKFGMHWHMMLQSDAQLESKYDKNIGSIIRANCTEIFLGSFDHDTAARFAISCGKTTYESLSTRATQQLPILETTDLITPDRLNLMEPGQAYVRSRRHPLLQTHYEAFYNCPEYVPVADLSLVYPLNGFDYRMTAFFPDDIPPMVSDKDFFILDLLRQNGPLSDSELASHVPSRELPGLMKKLGDLHMIDATEPQVRLTLTDWEFTSIRKRKEKEWIALYPSGTPPYPFMAEVAEAEKSLLMEQLLRLPLQDPQSLLQAEGFTCIPKCIKENMEKIANGQSPLQMTVPIRDNKLLRFEIIEAYVTAHDYSQKEEWVQVLQQEVAAIRQYGWFAPLAMDCFESALKEIDVELTLGNILEIRKILLGDS